MADNSFITVYSYRAIILFVAYIEFLLSKSNVFNTNAIFPIDGDGI